MNNDTSGVYFNDSSKMLAVNDEDFYYFEKIAKEDICRKFTFHDYPSDLKKKVSLFSHFKGYLNNHSENSKLSKIP